MSTLELEHLKHTSSSSNNLSTHSDGSLTLQSLNVIGDVAVDTDTLKVDATNDRVGINVASPTEALNVNSGSATTAIRIKSTASSVYQRFENSGSDNGYIGYSSNLELWANNNIGLTIGSTGAVNAPDQPGVNVTPSSAESGAYNSGSNGNEYCIWSTIRWQVGNNYNTANGAFTCPVAGKYFVSFHSNWYNNSNNIGAWLMIQIHKNNVKVEQWYETAMTTWMNEAGSTIVDCAANDTIRLYKQTASGVGGGADLGDYTGFCVRLLG